MSIEAGLRGSLGRLSTSVGRLAARFGRIVPPHAFVMTGDRLVRVSLEGDSGTARPSLGGIRTRSAALPNGSFRAGPGGVGVAAAGFSEAVGKLLGQGAKPDVTAASLSVPDAFVRVVAVDVEPGVDRNVREVEEVLQWKLDRTFEGAPPLRIAWQVAGPAPGGGIRIIGIGTPEEAVASWEEAFAAHGIRIGMIVPEVLAVAPVASSALEGEGLLVWAHGGTVSTAFFGGGGLRFLRTKAEDPDTAETVQEIRLFASFVAQAGTDSGGAGPAVAGPESSAVVARFAELRKENGSGDPIALRGVLVSRGLTAGLNDPAVLAGVGLVAGEE